MVGILVGLIDLLRTASTGTLGVDIITGESLYNRLNLSFSRNKIFERVMLAASNNFPFRTDHHDITIKGIQNIGPTSI